jgi:hypothetical protein
VRAEVRHGGGDKDGGDSHSERREVDREGVELVENGRIWLQESPAEQNPTLTGSDSAPNSTFRTEGNLGLPVILLGSKLH